MRQQLECFLLFAICFLLSACAISPSFEKSRDEMLSVLDAKPVCCADVSGLQFKKIERLPYKTSHFSSSQWDRIDDSSQILVIDGFKTYVMALDLPDVGRGRSIQIESMQTWSDVNKGGFMGPVVSVYDDSFHELAVHKNFSCGTLFGSAGPSASFSINKEAKYLVIYTNQESLGGYTSYWWNGSTSRCSENGVIGSGLPTIVGNAIYVPGRDLVTRPHLPEGAFFMTIQ